MLVFVLATFFLQDFGMEEQKINYQGIKLCITEINWRAFKAFEIVWIYLQNSNINFKKRILGHHQLAAQFLNSKFSRKCAEAFY